MYVNDIDNFVSEKQGYAKATGFVSSHPKDAGHEGKIELEIYEYYQHYHSQNYMTVSQARKFAHDLISLCNEVDERVWRENNGK